MPGDLTVAGREDAVDQHAIFAGANSAAAIRLIGEDVFAQEGGLALQLEGAGVERLGKQSGSPGEEQKSGRRPDGAGIAFDDASTAARGQVLNVDRVVGSCTG